MPREILKLDDRLFNSWFPKIYHSKARYLIPFGGAGSGKSVGVAQKLILKNIQGDYRKSLVTRKTKNSVENSVFAELYNVLDQWNITHWYKINLTKHSFHHRKNGNSILTAGLDDVERLKSIQGITDIWMEEATETDKKDFMQLNLRLRGIHLKDPQIILTFNPISEHNWIKKYFFDTEQKLTDDGRVRTEIIKTTYKDNRFLDPDYVEELNNLSNTDSNYYNIYVLGEWGVDDKSGKFAYAYKKEKHVFFKHADGSPGVPYSPYHVLYISFDFNVNPISALAVQHIDGVIRCIRSFKLKDANIYSLCDAIKAQYPEALFIVTGDATGQARSALMQDNVNYYTIIQSQLGIGDPSIQVPRQNPKLVENKVLVNALLENYAVMIDGDNCAPLIYDLTYTEVDTANKLIKDRVDETRKADALDTFRYYCNTFHWNFLRYYKK